MISDNISGAKNFFISTGGGGGIMDCRDSDGGDDIWTKGTATGIYNGHDGVFEDFCTGQNSMLTEYYCNNQQVISRNEYCTCYDGKCVEGTHYRQCEASGLYEDIAHFCDTEPGDRADCSGDGYCVIDGRCVATASTVEVNGYAGFCGGPGLPPKWKDCDVAHCEDYCGFNMAPGREDGGFGEYQAGREFECCGDDPGEYYTDGICCDSETDVNIDGHCAETIQRICLASGDPDSEDHVCDTDETDRAPCDDATDCVINGECININELADVNGEDGYCTNQRDGESKWVDCDGQEGLHCQDICGAQAAASGDGEIGEYLAGDGIECCGDDGGENYRTSEYSDENTWRSEPDYSLFNEDDLGITDEVTEACCNNARDCVFQGECFGQAARIETGYANNKVIMCHQRVSENRGVLLDCDGDEGYWCGREQDVCNQGWDNYENAAIASGESISHGGYVDGISDGQECCGDDSNEYIETTVALQGAYADDSIACCSSRLHCVFGGVCYPNDWDGVCAGGQYGSTCVNAGDSNGDLQICSTLNGGTWVDPDYGEQYCLEVDSHPDYSAKWMAGGTLSGEGTDDFDNNVFNDLCCGDDNNEYYKYAGNELTVEDSTLLLAHFNNGVMADYAEGNPSAFNTGPPVYLGYSNRCYGASVDGFTKLKYTTAGNFNKEQGTVEMWVKPQGANWNAEGHVFFLIRQDTGDYFALTKFGNYLKYWTEIGNDPPASLVAKYMFSWDPLFHVAITWGDERKLYLNGVEVGSSDYDGDALEVLPEYMYVGVNDIFPGGEENADAIIDEFRISDVALSPSQIMQDYQAGVGIQSCVCCNEADDQVDANGNCI